MVSGRLPVHATDAAAARRCNCFPACSLPHAPSASDTAFPVLFSQVKVAVCGGPATRRCVYPFVIVSTSVPDEF